MASLQGKLKHSLQWRLSFWLSAAILAIALPGGAISFYSAFSEANDLQDDQLRQMAALIDQHNLPTENRLAEAHAGNRDEESKIIVQVLDGRTPELGDDTALALPARLPDGLQTYRVGDEDWRLFVQTLHTGERLAVGQQTAVRDENAYSAATQTILPLVILIPVLIGMISLLVRRMLAPVAQLTAALDRKGEFELTELPDAEVPDEVLPFVAAINRLLSRLNQALALQRRFVADAAHELRTPLTALSLQLEELESDAPTPEARGHLLPLRLGIQRAKAMLEQLLTLARAQGRPQSRQQPVPLNLVMRRVLEDLWPQAAAKQIDIGVLPDGEVWVSAPELDLYTLLRNLADNAIRYTPEGGRVDLWAYNRMGQPILEVSDSGPGIPEEERERVFDPFYRIPGSQGTGSGLGLAIVRSIAERSGATISLEASEIDNHRPGLRVILRWPATPPAQPGPLPAGPVAHPHTIGQD